MKYDTLEASDEIFLIEIICKNGVFALWEGFKLTCAGKQSDEQVPADI